MATKEDREMMERISRLASQINRHKNEQAGFVPAPPSGPPSRPPPRHHNSWRRGGYSHRGGRGRTPLFRNRTLILNGGTPQTPPGDADSGTASDASTSSWVTKHDRHLQLINSSVYQKDAQARTAAIEQSRRQKFAQRDKQERAKLISHLNRMAAGGAFGAANPRTAAPAKYEIAIQGIRFIVAKNGSKLVKVPDDVNAAKATPKMAIVGGVKFYRSKNGNLYRHGIVKAQRQSGRVRKINVPCKQFSMTGSCTQGPRCRYIHDPHKVAICREFLQQGECANGDNCDLSHDPVPERTPTCLHFARDSCTKPDCRDFGFYGYCPKGAACPDRHVFECPDFSNTGVCKNKGCKLPHRERASVLRRGASGGNNNGAGGDDDDEMEDVSSDDDGESIDDDDVDSDEVDEFIGQDEDGDGGIAFAEQKDFIEL
ncbi:hypothetical protein VTJ49DRAFT_7328 [Mycothermus thermophilus]|uniref:C3H1-type domain-containing protein n=1 Tax=Humicola insolens TaxID=85995 RepID=A0ABR3VHL8_HUMIN